MNIIKPESEIWLCNVPDLNPDYSHTWLFDNKPEQEKYFKSKADLHFEKYSYLREDNAIKVFTHIDSIHGINYIMYKNKIGKWYYCFIMKKEYINELTTKLYIKTDIIQTYMFDFDLLESYIDRCHVDRWDRRGNLIKHDEPEDLEFGEYVEFGPRTELYKYDDNFLIFASNPLGAVDSRNIEQNPDGQTPPTPGPNPGEDVGPPTGGDWQNGKVSANLIRFIKSEEGYASKRYWDRFGLVWTIGYGVVKADPGTTERKAYDYLDAKNGASERECAIILDYLINNNYAKPIYKDAIPYLSKQQEFDAIVDFVYNLGTGAGPNGSSAPTLWKIIKQYKNGQVGCDAVRKQFGKYIYGENGQVVDALVERRKYEADMFCDGLYHKEDISVIDTNGNPTSKVVTENHGDGWLPS